MGLLDKFNRGMQAVQTGLLGNATAYNPQISQYLSPGVLEKANSDARMQLGLAMLAASESGMGFGQGLMMAQQAAGQAFRNPVEQNLQDTMRADAFRRMVEQRQQQEQLKQQIAQYRAANPQDANLPDEIILKKMDPNFGLKESELGLAQQQLAATLENNAADNARADKQLELQRQQLLQSGSGMTEQMRNFILSLESPEFARFIGKDGTPKSSGEVIAPILLKVKEKGEASLSPGEKTLFENWKRQQAFSFLSLIGPQQQSGFTATEK